MRAKQSTRTAVQRSRRSRWVLAAATGVLLTLVYPPFDVSVLAWGALVPLLVALQGATPGAAFLLGWLAGAVGSLGVAGFWIYQAARQYFHLSPIVAALFTTGCTQLYVGLYFGFFALAAALVGKRMRLLLIPALFVASEYARSHLLSGCPWELLGHSQASQRLIQLCDLTGVYGLSFLLALCATAATELRRTRVPAMTAAAAILLVLGYGTWRLAGLAVHRGTSLRIMMVQANLPNEQRGRPEFFANHLERYLDLTRSATTPPPDLIVWPENALGFFPEENASLVSRITDHLRAQRNALLAGAPRSGDRLGTAAFYNSAYLFSADGGQAVYDKRKLLPFVEHLPLRPQDGPYLPGGTPVTFSVAGTSVAALICYEAIYPELARELVERGARLLINISNDSWFEAGAGPEQHYQSARFRAVENRVSLVRVTNGGVSGVIDPAGREIARLPRGGPLVELVAVPIGAGQSFYQRHGDLFAFLCIVVTGAALALRLLGHFPQRWGHRPTVTR